MDREIFGQRFLEAATLALDYGRTYIEEPLPGALRFRVFLNSAHGGPASPDEVLFPEDSKLILQTKNLSAAEVVKLLWRDDLVPEWVDLCVAGATAATTIVDVLVCGRFTSDESRFCQVRAGQSLLHASGVALPAAHDKTRKLSIYLASSCWSQDELERVRTNARKVEVLELCGPAFTDGIVASLAFPKLTVLSMAHAVLEGRGLALLENVPSLCTLRIKLENADAFDFGHLSIAKVLTTASFRGLPRALRGLARMPSALPAVTDLTLGGSSEEVDAELDMPNVGALTLDLPGVPDWVVPSRTLRSLHVHAAQADDAAVLALLERCPSMLETVGLRGTPVTDAIFSALGRLDRLTYLDVVDTGVGREALVRFARARPKLTYLPRHP
jgi:hypothetical protein